MKTITRSEIQKLAQINNQPCVSLFFRFGDANRPGTGTKLEFAKLLDEGKALLGEWQDETEVRAAFKPLETLSRSKRFWSKHSGSVAVFVNGGEAHVFEFTEPVKNEIVVSDRFHLLPLLNVFVHNGEYFILALSRAKTRLLLANQLAVEEIKLKNMPAGLKELLDQKGRQRVPARVANGGVSFHAMVPATQWQDVALEDYCRLADKALRQTIGGKIIPLVLAGLPTIQATFRRISHYPQILENGLTTNPDRLSHENLHKRSWCLIAGNFSREESQATERFAHFAARDPKKITNDIEEIVRSAQVGRVDTLLIRPGSHVWGVYDEQLDDIVVHTSVQPGNYDLLDIAATQTFRNGGRVLPFTRLEGVRLPQVAAILRY